MCLALFVWFCCLFTKCSVLYCADAEESGEPTKVFTVDERNGGGAATLYTLFQLMFDGFMINQKEIKASRLPQLMACADYLQVECVTEACNLLLYELTARNDVCS